MSIVLVVNSGSSSLKYQLLDMEAGVPLASGLVERIGEPSGDIRHTAGSGEFTRTEPVADHAAAFRAMLASFDEHGPAIRDEASPVAVGHRVVHGGRRFLESAVIDDRVERDIEDLVPLAPLHNPANLEGIRGARSVFPDVPHVAVFDTAFHTTMPDAASLYAIDREVAEQHRVRKYGAHGTSHRYVARAAAGFLGRPLDELRLIVLHIGNGASACAVDRGRSIETSMGMTPLQGLVMGSRSGDIDPAVLYHLHEHAGMELPELVDFLNRRSGLRGLAGSGDMRDVEAAAAEGDERARLALDVYVHRLRHYIGAYLVHLGGADAIVWTAGVGENSPGVRRAALEGMQWLGIELDPARNEERSREPRRISTGSSRVEVLVIPTNEEAEIARESLGAIAARA